MFIGTAHRDKELPFGNDNGCSLIVLYALEDLSELILHSVQIPHLAAGLQQNNQPRTS
jgi:hypothetical protein